MTIFSQKRCGLQTPIRPLALLGALLVCGVTQPPPAAGQTWIGKKAGCEGSNCGNGHSWEDGKNWSGGAVPGQGANVVVNIPAVIDGLTPSSLKSLSVSVGQVFLSQACTIEKLVLRSGNLEMVNSLTVTNSMIWTGGSMGDDLHPRGVAELIIGANATLKMSGPGSKFKFGSIVNRGVATATGRGMTVGVFENEGTFTAENDISFNLDAVGGPFRTFNNSGNFFKTGEGSADLNSFQLNNTGFVRVSAGTLLTPSGGGSNGEWNVASGATLDFSNASQLGSGLQDFQTGTLVRGDGKILIRSGITSSTGVVRMGLPGSKMQLELKGGRLGGSVVAGDLFTFAGATIAWTGGDFEGNNAISAGTKTTVSGTNARNISGNFTQHGELTWQGAPIGISNGSIFLNSPSGQLFFAKAPVLSGAGRVVNEGKLIKTGSSPATWSPPILENRGVIEARGGKLTFENTLHLSNGSKLIGRGLIRTSQAMAKGKVSIGDGFSPAKVEHFGGDLSLSEQNSQMIVQKNANFRLTGGRITLDPSLKHKMTIAAGGNFFISGPGSKGFYGKIYNRGTTTLEGPGALESFGFNPGESLFQNDGSFVAADGATFSFLSSSNLLPPEFVNNGDLQIGTPTERGILNLKDVLFSQTAHGLLGIDFFGGGAKPIQFDQLINAGGASRTVLNGILRVQLPVNFTPAAGATFTILSSEVIESKFASLEQQTGSFLKAVYNPKGVKLR